MSTDTTIHDRIDSAADAVGTVWPLHSFVTANPLAGFEDQPFHEAVQNAGRLLGGDGYPSADVFRRAWESGRIDPGILASELDAHGYDGDPETLLEELAADGDDTRVGETPTERVDQVVSKWLAAFLDQGQAEWPMPNREQGFYAAFTELARYDSAVPGQGVIKALPEDPVEAIEQLLAGHPDEEWESILEHQLTALPGWTGYIKHRVDADADWQSTYPITLAGYLAVRLTLVDLFDAPVAPPEQPAGERGDERVPLAEVWLSAWEASYRDQLVEAVADADVPVASGERPDAQFVFCIDTRSEIIRRHIEAAGAYETHGYAGFFGIPMRHEGYDADASVDACPPILDPQHRITERPTDDHAHARHDRWTSVREAGGRLLKSLKSNAATAFSFVESAGSGYGVALAARTLFPGRVYDIFEGADEQVPDSHEFCTPTVDRDEAGDGDLPLGLTHDQQVEYAATAFELMGWEEFARVVVFAGHASQTENNPFGSSLDCGACAGNPGGPSARVLATICNDDAVRATLRERGFDIPEDTVFVAGEHNTTTDEVTVYTDGVPDSHRADIEAIRADLETARAGATAERAASMAADVDTGVRETERRAADWAQTRPEWGLAGNAAFVIGPRELTADLDLDGRAFLHSYDWRTDPDGDALGTIVNGPMIVTQWINSQYYFATVDTATYGSGSKITQNPVGNVGVYQGNGGDLMTGLPLQSLKATDDDPYHQPLRLSTVIHAPVERVTEILTAAPDVTELLDNGWLSLTVVDPTQDHAVFHYDGHLEWLSETEQPAVEPQQSPAVADD